jgi:hypothetical protein
VHAHVEQMYFAKRVPLEEWPINVSSLNCLPHWRVTLQAMICIELKISFSNPRVNGVCSGLGLDNLTSESIPEARGFVSYRGGIICSLIILFEVQTFLQPLSTGLVSFLFCNFPLFNFIFQLDMCTGRQPCKLWYVSSWRFPSSIPG